MKKKLWMLFGLSTGWACTFGFAHAYLDPAASSYLIQIISGVVITCGVVLGVYRKKIGMFFRALRLKMLEKRLSRKSNHKGGR
jgi:energy-converting hydrogenase Eha subunit C